MSSYKVISTKKLLPPLVHEAMLQGIEIIEAEMISVQPILNKEKWEEVDQWLASKIEHVVFTSPNAVLALNKYLNDYTSYHTPNWKIFCISGQTRKAIDQSSISGTIIDVAENGKALAEKILKHKADEVIFFCGDKRREELPTILSAHHIPVHEVIIYETRETPAKITNGISGILFFSPSAVQSFFSINQLKEETVCFAIGETTADSIRKFTNNQIIVSTSPSQESIMAAVIQYFQHIKLHE